MIRVFLEGGTSKGDMEDPVLRRSLTVRQQEGFNRLLSQAVPEYTFNVVISGGRTNACEEFARNFRAAKKSRSLLLLIDSEAPLESGAAPRRFLNEGAGPRKWTCPEFIPDECIHFMVRCMEAWILADRDTLRKFYGEHLDESRLPPPDAVLRVECPGLFAMLQAATVATEKGAYHKGRHSFDLIGLCSPDAIRKVSPFANRLFATLEQWTSESTNS